MSKISRRGFLKLLCAAAATAAVPVHIGLDVSDRVTRETYHYSLSEIITTTLRKRSDRLSDNVLSNNVLLERLQLKTVGP